MKRGNILIRARAHDRETAESARVMEREGAAVVEIESRPHMRPVGVEVEGARHAEVQHQFEVLVQRREEELAAAPDSGDATTDRSTRGRADGAPTRPPGVQASAEARVLHALEALLFVDALVVADLAEKVGL